MKKVLLSFIILFTIFIFSCPHNNEVVENNDVIIVFTNDVYNQLLSADAEIIKGNSFVSVGYPKVKALKSYLQKTTKSKVVLVDAGDFIFGDGKDSVVGQYSRGSKIIDVMNKTGYNYVCVGDKDLTFGASALDGYTKSSDFVFLCSNISKKSGQKSSLLSRIKTGYVVQKFGTTKVAFMALTTPNASNAGDLENWQIESPDSVIPYMRSLVDKARNIDHVDYIVLLSHIGSDDVNNSAYIAGQIGGINLVIDGNSKRGVGGVDDQNICTVTRTVDGRVIENKFYYGHCGRFMEKVGVFTISVPGKGQEDTPSLKYYDINEFDNYEIQDDESLETYIIKEKTTISNKLTTAIGVTSIPLTRYGMPSDIKNEDKDLENDFKKAKYKNAYCQESFTGDILADSFRYIADADIGIINAGGIGKNPIEEGEILLKNVYDLLPYMNTICTVNVTAKGIKDILEHSVSDLYDLGTNDSTNWNTQSYRYTRSGDNISFYHNVWNEDQSSGEFNGFLHVSGLLVTVDASQSVNNRITQIKILKKGLDPKRVDSYKLIYDSANASLLDSPDKYKLAGSNYLLISCNDGYTMFNPDPSSNTIDNPEYIKIDKKTVSEADALSSYIKSELDGNITSTSAEMYPYRVISVRKSRPSI